MFSKLYHTLADLPVMAQANEIAAAVAAGEVVIVVSPTGGGKTLVLSPKVADAVGDQISVHEPRRFLASNAAEIIADLSGLTLGLEVGFAVGRQSGDVSMISQNSRLAFKTYGYGLASGDILTDKTVIMDEIHEEPLDQSAMEAILHRRMAHGEKIGLLLMSATVDAERNYAYWSQVAPTRIVYADGSTHPCERKHFPAMPVEDAALYMVEHGYVKPGQGILIFRPGRGEAEETAKKVADKFAAADIKAEVALTYGEQSYTERKEAAKAPARDTVKVLVGTNVIESGVNIPWVRGGVSCGTGKEQSVNPVTGATRLMLVPLSGWRLQQQEGRVKRFAPGIFILCAQEGWNERPSETTPEILRLPLTSLVMHCAAFGLKVHDLTFKYPLEAGMVADAEEKLQRLNLIDADCRLTRAGKWVSKLPVGPETGAMLWHAKQLGILMETLPLAAVIEVDGLRKDFRNSHGMDGTSDWLDGLKAFIMAYQESDHQMRRKILEGLNISFKRFTAAKDFFHDLKRRMQREATFATIEVTEAHLRQCLVAGFITNLFAGYGTMRHIATTMPSTRTYNIGNGSAVSLIRGGYALGTLRTIQPKDRMKSAFTVLEKVTDVSVEDLLAVAKLRPDLIEVEQETVTGWRQNYIVTRQKLFGRILLSEDMVDAPLTADEAAAIQAEEEAARRQSAEAAAKGQARITNLNKRREALGLEVLACTDTQFISQGFSYAYENEAAIREAEALVAQAERQQAEDAERQKLWAQKSPAQLLAEAWGKR